MELVLKLSAAALAASVLGLILKKSNPEFPILITLAVSAVVLTVAVSVCQSIIGFVKNVTEITGISDEIVKAVLKTVGAAAVTKIASDVCKDAGQGGAASCIEFLGTAAGLYFILPLMQLVLDTMESLM